MRIILGVTGSIAAYKAADIANRFTKDGHEVDVIMTASALKLITVQTFQTLTKRRVYTEMFDEFTFEDVRHISLAKAADIALVAPCTANVIGKIAGGIADDYLTTVLLAVESQRILLAPAMNTAMWDNAVVQCNIGKLKHYGFKIIEPKESRLACGDLGKGALADIEAIIEAVYANG
jgi:phosphopantothenoylcysteine decarboxylase/phosphopantothenoylcysteine decarboxylase/phosphopantothenate--cysteine ligase